MKLNFTGIVAELKLDERGSFAPIELSVDSPKETVNEYVLAKWEWSFPSLFLSREPIFPFTVRIFDVAGFNSDSRPLWT